jgi:predicted nuclease of predicted toxin-antitoxin system
VNIKLDENLPERLVSELWALGHVVDTVRTEHLAGRDDTDIWQAAQSVDRFLITQDLDFSDVRRYTPGTHAGLLLVRLVRPGRDALGARVTMLFATEPVDHWRGCLLSQPTTRCGSSARCERHLLMPGYGRKMRQGERSHPTASARARDFDSPLVDRTKPLTGAYASTYTETLGPLRPKRQK